MVAPNPEQSELRVQVVRERETGRFVGFRDPESGRFISRTDAMSRLNYNPQSNRIEDSFGNAVGVGALAIPGRGIRVAYRTAEALYEPVKTDPSALRPGPNQEIVERTVFITKDGRLVTSETGFGLGKRYDPSKYGGRWRQAASEALGLQPSQRIPTSDLKRAVAYHEVMVRTIRT